MTQQQPQESPYSVFHLLKDSLDDIANQVLSSMVSGSFTKDAASYIGNQLRGFITDLDSMRPEIERLDPNKLIDGDFPELGFLLLKRDLACADAAASKSEYRDRLRHMFTDGMRSPFWQVHASVGAILASYARPIDGTPVATQEITRTRSSSILLPTATRWKARIRSMTISLRSLAWSRRKNQS